MEKTKRKLNKEDVVRKILRTPLNGSKLEKECVAWTKDHWDQLDDDARRKMLEHSLGISFIDSVYKSVSSSVESHETHRVSLRLPVKWVEKMDVDRRRRSGIMSRNQWIIEMIKKYFE